VVSFCGIGFGGGELGLVVATSGSHQCSPRDAFALQRGIERTQINCSSAIGSDGLVSVVLCGSVGLVGGMGLDGSGSVAARAQGSFRSREDANQ